MTLQQLQYVVEVAKTGSINRAAANLFISQSVISGAVANLEKEIGQDIFYRSNRGVTVTPFGRTFVSYVSSIQTQLSQLDHLISRGSVAHGFHLSIASTGYYFLDDICAEIYQKYRSLSIRIELIEDHINNIADAVESQTAEFGIINMWSCYKGPFLTQIHAKRLQYYPIASLAMAVSVGKNHPFYHDADRVDVAPEELSGYPSVLYPYHDSGPYSDIYSRLKIRESGNRIVCSSRSSIYEMLRKTDAFYLNSVYPFDLIGIKSDTFEDFRTLPLRDCSIRSEIGWLKREDQTMSMPANDVIQRFSELFGYMR